MLLILIILALIWINFLYFGLFVSLEESDSPFHYQNWCNLTMTVVWHWFFHFFSLEKSIFLSLSLFFFKLFFTILFYSSISPSSSSHLFKCALSGFPGSRFLCDKDQVTSLRMCIHIALPVYQYSTRKQNCDFWSHFLGENLVIWLPLTLRIVRKYHQGYFWESYLGIILQGNYCDQLLILFLWRKEKSIHLGTQTTQLLSSLLG